MSLVILGKCSDSALSTSFLTSLSLLDVSYSSHWLIKVSSEVSGSGTFGMNKKSVIISLEC